MTIPLDAKPDAELPITDWGVPEDAPDDSVSAGLDEQHTYDVSPQGERDDAALLSSAGLVQADDGAETVGEVGPDVRQMERLVTVERLGDKALGGEDAAGPDGDRAAVVAEDRQNQGGHEQDDSTGPSGEVDGSSNRDNEAGISAEGGAGGDGGDKKPPVGGGENSDDSEGEEPKESPSNPGDAPDESDRSDHPRQELTPQQERARAANRAAEPELNEPSEDEVVVTLPYGRVEASVEGEEVHIEELRVPEVAQRDQAASRMLTRLGEWAQAHGLHTMTGDVVSSAALGPRAKVFGTDSMTFYRYVPDNPSETESLDMTYTDAVAYLQQMEAIPEEDRPEDFTLGVRTDLSQWRRDS